MSIVNQKPKRRMTSEKLVKRLKNAKAPRMTVAIAKFATSHNTLVLGLDLRPNGLLKTFFGVGPVNK
jgi:hypothetical protein